jgi:hypothetical protein
MAAFSGPFLKLSKSVKSLAFRECRRTAAARQACAGAKVRKSFQNSEANHQKTGRDRPPLSIQIVKRKRVFENTVTLRIEDGCRRGVGWLEAMRRVDWYLTFDRAECLVAKFLFGK